MRFNVACAQMCGWAHYAMSGYVTVYTPQQFDRWYEQAVTDGNREDLAGGLDGLTFLDGVDVAQDHGSDAVLVEVQREANGQSPPPSDIRPRIASMFSRARPDPMTTLYSGSSAMRIACRQSPWTS